MNKKAESYYVWIYLSGNRDIIEHSCREFVMRGLCVTVESVKYIYTGGEELGVRIGLINYPRFPLDKEKIWDMAIELARKAKKDSYQSSVLIMDKEKTLWITDRQE